MPYCPNCAHKISDTALNCPSCGHTIASNAPPKTDWLKRASEIFTLILVPAITGLYVFGLELKNTAKQNADALQKQLTDEFSRGQSRVENAQELLKILSEIDSADAKARKRNVLFAIAYQNQLPPAILPMLALTDVENDAEVTTIFLETLQALSETNQPAQTRRYAAIAIKKLASGTIEGKTPQATVAALGASEEVVQKLGNTTSGAGDDAKVLASITQGIVSATVNETPEVAQRASEAFSTLPAEIKTTEVAFSQLPPEARKNIKPRVYIHIANERQESAGKNVKEALIENDYLVPLVRNLERNPNARVPTNLEVRYFSPESKDKALAILEILKSKGFTGGDVSFIPPSNGDRKTSQDIASHFEVWSAPTSVPES